MRFPKCGMWVKQMPGAVNTPEGEDIIVQPVDAATGTYPLTGVSEIIMHFHHNILK